MISIKNFMICDSYLNCTFLWLSLNPTVSPPLIVLWSKIAPASWFATLLSDVLIATTVYLIAKNFLTMIIPITKLKTQMKLAMRTTSDHLFCCVYQFSILVLKNAKSSLVRCTFSLLTAQYTTPLNVRVYLISTSSFLYDYTCTFWTVRITRFSDSSIPVTVKWSSDSGRSFPWYLLIQILIQFPSAHPFLKFCYLYSKIAQMCHMCSIIDKQIHIHILRGENIFPQNMVPHLLSKDITMFSL